MLPYVMNKDSIALVLHASYIIVSFISKDTISLFKKNS